MDHGEGRRRRECSGKSQAGTHSAMIVADMMYYSSWLSPVWYMPSRSTLGTACFFLILVFVLFCSALAAVPRECAVTSTRCAGAGCIPTTILRPAALFPVQAALQRRKQARNPLYSFSLITAEAAASRPCSDLQSAAYKANTGRGLAMSSSLCRVGGSMWQFYTAWLTFSMTMGMHVFVP